jgi:hypothetical protein
VKATCEIVVARDAFAAALIESPTVINLLDPWVIELSPCAVGLRVLTASMSADIAGEGVWSRRVGAVVDELRPIIDRTLGKPTLTLIYAAGRLFVNRTAIDGYVYPEECTAFRSPAGRERQALIDAPVDLGPLAARPMRPARRQHGAGGLPLFSKPGRRSTGD